MKLRAAALLLLILASDSSGRTEFESLYQDGRAAFVQGDFDHARLIAHRGAANPQFDAEGRELFALLEAEIVARSTPDAALTMIDWTPPSGTARARARRFMTRGYALIAADKVAQADRALAKAARIAERQVPDLGPEIANLRAQQAIVAKDFELAERFAQEALNGARMRRQHVVRAYALINLGLAELNLERWREALDHFRRAERITRALDLSSTLAALMGNFGWAYAQLGDFEEAETHYRHAEEIAEQLGDLRRQPTWLTNIAYLEIARRQYAAARPYAERAVAAAQRLGNDRKVAGALVNLAQVQIGLGQFVIASRLNAQAMRIGNALKDSELQFQALLNAAQIDDARGNADGALLTLAHVASDAADIPQLRWQALAAAASIERRLGHFARAEQLYEAALETGDVARDKVSDDAYLFAFETNLIRFYDEMIDLLLSRGRTLDALGVAERSRAVTLLTGKGVLKRGRPAERKLDAQALARANNAAIVSYWFTSEHSWMWVVTAKEVTVLPLPPASIIDQQIAAYRDEILRGHSSVNSRRGAQLYETLVAPAVSRARTSRFIIVPDGKLVSVPVETFIVPTPEPHYWIDDATITYTPSITLLADDDAPHIRNSGLLVMGNILQNSAEFPLLTRAGDEINSVAKHFAQERRVVLDGPRATPAAYAASNPRRFEYVHFVTHGTASAHAPLDSAVVLTGGLLTGHEIVNNGLDADLVTVSSCNSAGSRSYAGEGLVGLAWAFLRAGAHRVVAAQWDVSDTSTPKLMDVMYGELAAGRDPASALRAAKRTLLHTRTTRDPFYWAPFILYGAP